MAGDGVSRVVPRCCKLVAESERLYCFWTEEALVEGLGALRKPYHALVLVQQVTASGYHFLS